MVVDGRRVQARRTLGAVATVDRHGRQVAVRRHWPHGHPDWRLRFTASRGGGGGFLREKVCIIGLIFLYNGYRPLRRSWLLNKSVPWRCAGRSALPAQANFASNMLVALLFLVARDALKHVVGETLCENHCWRPGAPGNSSPSHFSATTYVLAPSSG